MQRVSIGGGGRVFRGVASACLLSRAPDRLLGKKAYSRGLKCICERNERVQTSRNWSCRYRELYSWEFYTCRASEAHHQECGKEDVAPFGCSRTPCAECLKAVRNSCHFVVPVECSRTPDVPTVHMQPTVAHFQMFRFKAGIVVLYGLRKMLKTTDRLGVLPKSLSYEKCRVIM